MVARTRWAQILIGFALATCVSAVGQAPGSKRAAPPAGNLASGSKSSVQPKTAAAKKWRTPWGDPDLQGSWSNATTTPLQRPAKYAGREALTADERAALNKQTAIATDKRDAHGTAEDVNGAYNGG